MIYCVQIFLIPILFRHNQDNPGMVLTLDNMMHGLEDDDKIEFLEVVGMTALNGTTQSIKGSPALFY